jgi:CRP-like cAMP-binding protein
MAERLDPCRANRLLAALPPAELAELSRSLHTVDFRRGKVVARTGDPLDQVWFPLDAVVSVTSSLADGGTAETATIGREGVVGLVTVLGNSRALGNQVVQVAGRLAGMDSVAFRAAFDERPDFRRLCLRYNEALFGQVLQSVACNALHPVEARLARWTLMLQDRQGDGATLQLTHEFFAEMLGVHRPTVTVVARTLQTAGLIRYRRGVVEVLDRPGLEQASCECYGIVRELYDRLLPMA